MTELRYPEAIAAYDAAEALLGDGAGEADGASADHWDDIAVDHWLELMVDGWAHLHVMRFEADLALSVLERARPLLEQRGSPARRTAFYRLQTMQRLLRSRLRVEDADIASLRAAVAMGEQTGEDKDMGYAIQFLGWALWLRGDLTEAEAEQDKALRLAERTGETHLRDLALLGLTLTAVRRHDTEAVRALLPRAFASLRVTGGHAKGRIAGAMACAAWLAWQDGRPDEVVRLAAEIGQHELSTFGSGAVYRWVYLFPLLAVRLQAGEIDAAVAAARGLIDPTQMRLPDDLTAALAAACGSWADGKRTDTEQHLATALALASANAYF
jgi:hypothetical protein